MLLLLLLLMLLLLFRLNLRATEGDQSEKVSSLLAYTTVFWYYRKRGSASYIVREIQITIGERERETEVVRRKWWDGSDVTIVALKLAINLHFPLTKIRTYRFPLRTSRLSLHGEVTRDGSDVTIVALKLAISLHFPLPKIRTYRFPLHTSRLSLHGEVTSMKHRKTRSN